MERTAPTALIWRVPVVGTSSTSTLGGQRREDDECLKSEPHPPRGLGPEKPTQQRADGTSDVRRCTDQCTRPLLGAPGEAAADQRLQWWEQ